MHKLTTEKMVIGLHKYLCEADKESQVLPEIKVYLCGMLDRAFDVSKNRISPGDYVVPASEFEKTIDKIEKDEKSANDAGELALAWLKGYYTCKYTGEFNVVEPVFRGQMPQDIFFPQACYSYARPFAVKMKRFEEGHIFGILGDSLEKHTKILLGFVDKLYSDGLKLSKSDYEAFRDDFIAYAEGMEKKPSSALPEVKEETSKDIII